MNADMDNNNDDQVKSYETKTFKKTMQKEVENIEDDGAPVTIVKTFKKTFTGGPDNFRTVTCKSWK